MKRIVLMGNPNVGKSAIFSHLTGARVNVSNYPGTTVEFTRGFLRVPAADTRTEGLYEVLDAPGTYSLNATCKAEEVAVDLLETADVVFNVVDATNLERNLYLTLQILERGIPVVILLNLWDEAIHKGIDIDVSKLEQALGAPVVPTIGLTGKGLSDVIERLMTLSLPAGNRTPKRSRDEIWTEIGRILASTQTISHRHHTWLEILQEASVKPVSGFILAAVILYSSLRVVTFLGEGLVDKVFDPFFARVYTPLIIRLHGALGGQGLAHDILIGRVRNGGIDYESSLGVLTTGVYIDFGVVLPYLLSFYLVLGFLEDLGYLPRLGVLLDRLMHRLGLHGYAILPMILGFGCNVPGALAARNLESKRERFIALTLMSISIPCAAQQGMIVGLVGRHGAIYLGIIFSTLFAVFVVLGVLQDRFVSGYTPSMIVEMPPYRWPYWRSQGKKLWMRMSHFIFQATPYILGGVLLVNVLYATGVVAITGHLFSPLVKGVFGLPEEAVSALIIGFLRKDVAVAMLGPLSLTPKQLSVGATVMAVFFPCAATFTVLFRELGFVYTLKSACIMFVTAVAVGGGMNLLLDNVLTPVSYVVLAILAPILLAMFAPGASECREERQWRVEYKGQDQGSITVTSGRN
ncbi:MAG TPA: ferrous iron transporter B [Clostridia bacterium]|nr:ferrous iron transporter B [Clostridia bacterium]